MGLFGGLVKTAVAIGQKLDLSTDSAEKAQEKQLKELLEKAKGTSFGKYYGFANILEQKDPIKAFQKQVPIHHYSDISAWWEQQQKFPDITWPGKPDYFALSSGTTGSSSKRIPITDELSQSMRKVGVSLVTELPNFNLPEEVFESNILMLSSSAKLSQHKQGHLEGEISGINVHKFPDWYDFFYQPGKEIAAIDNWDDRVAKIAEAAPQWDIGAIAGIPSWVLLMLQEVMKKHKLKYIQEIWPNFSVYASGGVAYETYRADFDKLSNKPLTIIDTYLASEGFFSYTARPNTMSMRLALSHGYFYEFIPFDERGVDEHGEIKEKPEVLNIDQVEKGQEYVLVISSCAGAWRYIIGDTIKFSSLEPYELKISGRTKFFLNVVGSQLSEEKMNDAIVELGNHFNVSINEFIVGAIKNQNNEHIHQWVLVCDGRLIEDQAAQELDAILKNKNKNYAVARSKALKEVRVKVISKKQYKSYLEANKKAGGQVKTPKVMKAEKMESLLEFLT
ncbi:MAG: GH3 auxin-responsive promoter family protein [Vicingaceae bacterium]